MNKETIKELFRELKMTENQAQIKAILKEHGAPMPKPDQSKLAIGFQGLLHKGWICLVCVAWKDGQESFAVYALPGRRAKEAPEFFSAIIPDITEKVMGKDCIPKSVSLCNNDGKILATENLATVVAVELPVPHYDKPWRN